MKAALAGAGPQKGPQLGQKHIGILEAPAHAPKPEKWVFLLIDVKAGNILVAADVQGAYDHLPACGAIQGL